MTENHPMNLYRKIILFIATGFGLGFSPIAPGTAGTLPGILIVWAIWSRHNGWLTTSPLQIAAAILLPLLAIPACSFAEKHFGKKDDRRIVADEYLTFPITMLGLPFTPWVVAIAFLTSRCFDILKPPPARQLQSVHGGTGIVIDDVFASLYSLVANHVAYWVISRWWLA